MSFVELTCNDRDEREAVSAAMKTFSISPLATGRGAQGWRVSEAVLVANSSASLPIVTTLRMPSGVR